MFYNRWKKWRFFHILVLYLQAEIIKFEDMILIIDPNTHQLTPYRTLISACKKEKWMKYGTLKNKHLSLNGLLYKGKWLYRIQHSWRIVCELFWLTYNIYVCQHLPGNRHSPHPYFVIHWASTIKNSQAHTSLLSMCYHCDIKLISRW